MAAAVVFKVRCPACGKGLRVENVEPGAQVFCRACGARMQMPAPPLLGPVVDDPSAIPVLEALLISGDGTARAPEPQGALTPLAPEVQVQREAPLSTPPSPDNVPLAAIDRPEPAAPQPAFEPVPEPTQGHEGNFVVSAELPGDDSEVPPWAAVAAIPATKPPPVPAAAVPAAPPRQVPPRLVPTRIEPPDPDLEQQRLAMAPPWIPPPQPVQQVTPTAVAPVAANQRHDPLADTDIQPAIREEPRGVMPAGGMPTDDDIRTVLAAHRAGQLKLVEGHHRHGHPFWWALLGMLSAAAVVLIALVWTGQVNWFNSWEKQAYPTVAQFKAEAEAFAVRGALKESHDRYRKIDDLIGGREVHDERLREIVQSARDDAKRVYGLLLSRLAEPAVVVAPPPPATQAVVTEPGTKANPGATATTTVRPPAVGTGVDPNPRVAPSTQVASVTEPRVGRESPPARTRPAPRPVRRAADAPLTDAEIGESIQSGVNYLLKQFDGKTNLVIGRERGGDAAYFAGLDALAVYALLQAGQAIDDPRISHRGAEMRARLEALRALPIEGAHQTYARGLRATCLALFNRPEDFKVMANDVDWLLGTTDGGAFGYSGDFRNLVQRGNFPSRNGSWDNSNSQYGLLGVWSGIEADPRIEVPMAFWKAVDRHWTNTQIPDGQWGYVESGSGTGRLTMTCAGLASLFVAHEYLEPPTTSGTVGREPFSPALRKGLEWFERGDNSVKVRNGNWWGYSLYGIERVGLASGFKHFGAHDWYRELAEQIVKKQLTNGSWGDGVVDTSYAVLFLSRGRHPILMNKLRFDGYWSNRPRDASNMARFAGRQFERPINWQVVNVENPWTDWTDSPILYIASHEPPKLTDEHLAKLRSFVRSGGMIFTHADAGSPTFDKWARELAAKLFPYELTDVPENHAIWSSVYKLTARPALLGVSNGSRLLMVHSPSDITLKWQQRADRAFEARPDPARPATVVAPDSETKTRMLSSFHFGMNLFVYAAGKRDLRNRLDSAWIERPAAAPVDTIRIARIQYGGNWDPEPGAWERYGNWFQQTTGTRLEIQPVKLGDLKADTVFSHPMAHLTGTARVGFTDADAAALRSYVEAGGVVLIDPTGGMNAFDTEVRETLLVKAFPDRFARLLDPGHPLMSAGAPGMEDVGKTIVRGYTLERLGGGIGTLQILTPATSAKPGDKAGPNPGAVIVTSLDLTSGLLGTNVWGILGFQNRYAQNVVKNAIFWTVDGRAQK
ncbi:DUF4159 domain-containing protein [Humisphaera borealis]|uniref:DUF4159 domain-containing protein n=1 Tax=Humisphaera borealis TaxID=2807512 RepID=A0A7M2X303_9BACT|nr:DUF4159 domain-containing protein [Humisphaera borealis]QOV92157.1 DUF4159 domain-containing protein [Humisphaera borealis]